MASSEIPAFRHQSSEYRRAREKLLRAELALIDQRERVAELRRSLPRGAPLLQNYIFTELCSDGVRQVHISDLFGKHDCLIVVHFMFAPEAEAACPMCNMWADGYNNIVPHIQDQASFVIVAKQEIHKFEAWAKARRWNNLRLLSSGDSNFNADFGVEDEQSQKPAVSVFSRDDTGEVVHFYTSEASLEPGHHRGLDLLSPVWNILDLTPRGRRNWFPPASRVSLKDQRM